MSEKKDKVEKIIDDIENLIKENHQTGSYTDTETDYILGSCLAGIWRELHENNKNFKDRKGVRNEK